MSLFELLFAAPSDPLPAATAAEFLALHRERHGALGDPFLRAVAAGLSADRLGYAFAGGYQAALTALAPAALGVAADGSAASSSLACLALTEAGGNTPRAIAATVVEDDDGLSLSGEKTFVTLGSLSTVLLVLARRGAGFAGSTDRTSAFPGHGARAREAFGAPQGAERSAPEAAAGAAENLAASESEVGQGRAGSGPRLARVAAGEPGDVQEEGGRGNLPPAARGSARAWNEPTAAERVPLVLVRVPAGTPGVTVVDRDPLPMVPEIGHGIARFVDARLPPSAVLPGDGWERYGRPFRTLEDVHVHAAALAYLAALGRRHAFGAGWAQVLGARLAALATIAAAPPGAATTHLALAGALADAEALHAALEPLLERVPAEERARWERDRPLLRVAGGARALRAQRAAERLGLE